MIISQKYNIMLQEKSEGCNFSGGWGQKMFSAEKSRKWTNYGARTRRSILKRPRFYAARGPFGPKTAENRKTPKFVFGRSLPPFPPLPPTPPPLPG